MSKILVRFQAFGERNGIPVDSHLITGNHMEEIIVDSQRLYGSGMYFTDVVLNIVKQQYPEVNWKSVAVAETREMH